jgi:hypothetical protein
VLARLKSWVRGRRHIPTPEELEGRGEAERLLEEKDTLRALDRFGPRDMVPGSREDTGRPR